MAIRTIVEKIRGWLRSMDTTGFREVFTECLEAPPSDADRHVKPSEIPLDVLYEGFLGPHWRDITSNPLSIYREEVLPDAFPNLNAINASLVQSRIMEEFRTEEFFLLNHLLPVAIAVDGEAIQGGKEHMILNLLGNDLGVNPGEPGVENNLQNWMIEFPGCGKMWHEIISVSEEQMRIGPTEILTVAANRGRNAGYLGEIECLKALMGLAPYTAAGAKPYKEGAEPGPLTAYDVYQAATPWINVITGNELVNFTDLEAVEGIFDAMVDPVNSMPILGNMNSVLVMPAKRGTLYNLLNTSSVTTQGGAALPDIGAAPNRFQNIFSQFVGVSRQAKALLVASGISASDANKYWFAGDFRQAIGIKQATPMTVYAADSNGDPASGEYFNRRISHRWAVKWWWTPYVKQPRYIVRSSG